MPQTSHSRSKPRSSLLGLLFNADFVQGEEDEEEDDKDKIQKLQEVLFAKIAENESIRQDLYETRQELNEVRSRLDSNLVKHANQMERTQQELEIKSQQVESLKLHSSSLSRELAGIRRDDGFSNLDRQALVDFCWQCCSAMKLAREELEDTRFAFQLHLGKFCE
ncbi:hypothetical protein BASA81_003411 [Batrachochytrium salamandrivorans]|nr:hypothetical protein BASA81_003411 [Batrachochytrium salamandrivorans]